MKVLAAVLLCVSTALAYQVTYPGVGQSWNTSGPNTLRWDRVITDPLTFAVVLTNDNLNVMPSNNLLLDPTVDGTLGAIQCSAPTGGWPSGTSFRVNLVMEANDLSGLLAQSEDFNITLTPSSTSTSTKATAASTSASVTSSTTPTNTNAAFVQTDINGLFAAVVMLTAVFATVF